MDLFSQCGLVAALETWEMGGLTEAAIDPTRLGVIVSSGINGMTTLQDQVRVMDKKGAKRVTPFLVPMVVANMAAGSASIRLGVKGPSQTIVTACASVTNTISEAFCTIKYGLTGMMVTGDTEATVCEIGIAGFAALNVLNTTEDVIRASVSFDKGREGFVVGEGAEMLALEELGHTQRRGTAIYGEIVGYGNSCDASHMTAPLEDGSGAAAVMEVTIAEARITPEQIGYINAHGMSTPANNATEITVIKRVFDERASQIPISSTESMAGHLLGTTGGIETITCVQTLQEGRARPIVGY